MTGPLRGVALRLHGPLQAWGGPVVGDDRPTLAFPTRSGVLGLLAACIGILRSENERLLALASDTRVHIRVDAHGTPLVDDQTIQDNPKASGTRQTIQSKRGYLCDASFTAVVVPGPGFSLPTLAAAARTPVFAPFLGRRTCVPSAPILLAAEVRGDDPVSIFAGIPPGPTDLIEQLHRHDGEARQPAADFYLDVPDYPGALRRIPVRDALGGPLLRQWRERFVVHVRARAESARA